MNKETELRHMYRVLLDRKIALADVIRAGIFERISLNTQIVALREQIDDILGRPNTYKLKERP